MATPQNLLVLLRDDKVKYTDVCNILEAKYGANRSYTDVVETLTFMCSKQYADLHDFVVEIKRQVRRTDLGQEASRRLVRQTFVAGLADRAQRAYFNRKDVAKDDVMTALHYASEYERRWTAISNVTSPSTQKAAARATPSEDTREVNTVKQFIDNKEAAWQLKIDKLEVQNELLRSSLATLRQRLDDVQKRQEQTTRPTRGNSYDGYNGRQDTRFRRRGQRGNHGRTVRFDLREQECHSDARQQQQTAHKHRTSDNCDVGVSNTNINVHVSHLDHHLAQRCWMCRTLIPWDALRRWVIIIWNLTHSLLLLPCVAMTLLFA